MKTNFLNLACKILSLIAGILILGSSGHTQVLSPDVVFDPGHGGYRDTDPAKAPGSLTPIDGYYEKDVNLEVALKLKDTLDAHWWVDSVDYFFTRVTDTGVYETRSGGPPSRWVSFCRVTIDSETHRGKPEITDLIEVE